MSKVNFYKMKYEALEMFYGWVDQNSDYDVAVEQSIYYNKKTDELDEIIFNITIATRFARCGREVSNKFKERLERVISEYKNIDLDRYCLSNSEINVLNEEIDEVKELIQMK